ncbi:MAG: YraN family protein [Oscillospiraceae bacterium]|nr:YraN family protein [Oscillospiraceae bacterium]
MDVEGELVFSFDGYLSVVSIDKQGEKDLARFKHNGASIVDIIAENEDRICFIEVKNPFRTSGDENVQIRMDNEQVKFFDGLRAVNAFSIDIMRKFEHALFVWIASGRPADKPIAFILYIDKFETELLSQERLKFIDHFNKYIPNIKHNPLFVESATASVSFDMPTAAEAGKRYGFTVTPPPALP